jgi:hypothetical protein
MHATAIDQIFIDCDATDIVQVSFSHRRLVDFRSQIPAHDFAFLFLSECGPDEDILRPRNPGHKVGPALPSGGLRPYNASPRFD